MNRIVSGARIDSTGCNPFIVPNPQKEREDSQKNMMHLANTAGEWIIQAFYQLKSDIMTVSARLSPFQPSKLPETKEKTLDPDAAKKEQEDVWKKRFIYTTIGIAGLAAIIFGLYQFGCFASKTELLNQQQLKLDQQAQDQQRLQEDIKNEKDLLQARQKNIGKQELQQQQQQLKLNQQAQGQQAMLGDIENKKKLLHARKKRIEEQSQSSQQASKTQEEKLTTLQQQLNSQKEELKKKQETYQEKQLGVNKQNEQLESQAKELQNKQKTYKEKLLEVVNLEKALNEKLQDKDLQSQLKKIEEEESQLYA